MLKQKQKCLLGPFWDEAKAVEKNCFCFCFLLSLPCKYFEAISRINKVDFFTFLKTFIFRLNLEGCLKITLLNPC